MGEERTACACQRVIYDPIDNGNGSWTERWRCDECKSVFVRIPAVPELGLTEKLSERELAREHTKDQQVIHAMDALQKISNQEDSAEGQPEPRQQGDS